MSVRGYSTRYNTARGNIGGEQSTYRKLHMANERLCGKSQTSSECFTLIRFSPVHAAWKRSGSATERMAVRCGPRICDNEVGSIFIAHDFLIIKRGRL